LHIVKGTVRGTGWDSNNNNNETSLYFAVPRLWYGKVKTGFTVTPKTRKKEEGGCRCCPSWAV